MKRSLFSPWFKNDKRDDFNFPIVNFPFIYSNIPAAPAYGVYISQMIRYSRACGSYQDFLDRGLLLGRRVWRYQRGNQNPYIEKEQKTQWLKEKVQKDKQRSTKHTHKTKDRVTRTPLKSDIRILIAPLVSSKLFLANRNCSFDIYQ